MFVRNLYRAIIPVCRNTLKLNKMQRISNFTDSQYSKTFRPTSVIFTRSYSENTEMVSVDFDYVKNATQNENVLIVDVREPEEIQELGKIPNSVNIPLGYINSVLNITDKEFQDIYNKPKPSQDTEIIFYCMIGKRSGKAQKDALSLGFKNSKNYTGSWTDWASKTLQK